jgi:hypothetical protein
VADAASDVWSWLTGVALDGIVGAVVGGAVAAWAIRRTIAHERQQRAADVTAAGDAERARELDGFRRQIADAYRRLVQAPTSEGTPHVQVRACVVALRSDLVLLQLDARRLKLTCEPSIKAMQDEVGALQRVNGEYDGSAVRQVQTSACQHLLALLEQSKDW